MILCDAAAAAGARRPLLCAFQATKSEKCQGDFFTVFHMQRGEEEGGRSPMLRLRQGRRQAGPPSSDCEFQGSRAGNAAVCSPLGLTLHLEGLELRPQTLVHLRPPPQRAPETGRGRDAGHTRWVYATVACSPACHLLSDHEAAAGVRAQRGHWVGPPSGTSEEPRCSPEASWQGGNALPESQ